MLQHRGIGLEIDKSDLTKENIVAAIRKVVYEPNYMRRAKELSEIIRNKPMQPDELFVKHVEFAAKYNVHEALDMHGRYLNTVQYYNLDIIGLLLTTITIVLSISFLVLRCIVRRCFCRKSGNKKSTKVEQICTINILCFETGSCFSELIEKTFKFVVHSHFTKTTHFI